jgi:hypothetical protein
MTQHVRYDEEELITIISANIHLFYYVVVPVIEQSFTG